MKKRRPSARSNPLSHPWHSTIPLTEILRAHDSYITAPSQRFCLGDGFLYQNNPIWKNIRDLYIACGFSFRSDDFCNYWAMSLNALPQMLEAGSIPVFDNVSVLRKLESDHPGVFEINRTGKLGKNYLLHESSHLIADILMPYQRIGKDAALEEKQELYLRILVAESFANANEIFATVPCHSVIHREFLNQNSYQPLLNVEETQTLQRVSIQLGFRASFQLLLIGCLAANFYPDFSEFTRAECEQIAGPLLEISGITPEIAPDILHLLRFGANRLPRGFRVATAKFYFAKVGIATDLPQLIQGDMLAQITAETSWRNRIMALASFAEFGAKSPFAPAIVQSISDAA